jgi:mono-ADP-ribosyltransferase sirtuin 6
LKRLTGLIRESRHTVVLTGAGISTSAGIPDFRGPQGIWTAEKKKTAKKRKLLDARPETKQGASVEEDFSKASPTLTHRAICKLVELHKIQYCITQNVDGLHRRSGLSRQHHSVLHGCVFTEVCEDCKTEHFRDYDVGGMSFQPTGRECEECKGSLRDILLDWDDELPEEDLERATDHCLRADLVLCLGTSLRIEPAGSLPTLARKFVIVNLQETPYDKEATLIVRAPVDEVMNEVMTQLGCPDWDNRKEGTDIERLWKPPKESKTDSKK